MQFAVFTRRALTATKQGKQRISKAKLVDATEEINQNRILGVIFILNPSHGVSFSRIVDWCIQIAPSPSDASPRMPFLYCDLGRGGVPASIACQTRPLWSDAVGRNHPWNSLTPTPLPLWENVGPSMLFIGRRALPNCVQPIVIVHNLAVSIHSEVHWSPCHLPAGGRVGGGCNMKYTSQARKKVNNTRNYQIKPKLSQSPKLIQFIIHKNNPNNQQGKSGWFKIHHSTFIVFIFFVFHISSFVNCRTIESFFFFPWKGHQIIFILPLFQTELAGQW